MKMRRYMDGHKATHIGKLLVIGFSPWPFLISTSVLLMVLGLVYWFHYQSPFFILVGTLGLFLFCVFWFENLINEATYLNYHTRKIRRILYYGMLFFILSEALFFVSFFWVWFYNLSNPGVEIGQSWPPKGFPSLHADKIPLYNTLLLLSSGATVTWSHKALKRISLGNPIYGLGMTILYAIAFILLQAKEYYFNKFTLADNVYGSIFYMLTGFHGFHVICGTIFLIVCFVRMWKGHFQPFHHVGYVCAIWYWHFVDLIWIIVFFSIYIPSGSFFYSLLNEYIARTWKLSEGGL